MPSKSSALDLNKTSLRVSLDMEISEEARAYARDAYSANTQRAYAHAWDRYVSWCVGRGVEAMPSTPRQVANFLAEEARSLKPSTLALRLSAIAKAHHLKGVAFDRRHPAISDVMRGIRRSKGIKADRKDALGLEDLRRIASRLLDRPTEIRDRALLLLGFAGALRRSELVALNRSDVRFHDNGLILSIRRSKTDAEGKGVELGVCSGRSSEACPVAAVRDWLRVLDSADDDPALFRRVTKGGHIGKRLSDRSVARIVQSRAAAVGLDGNFAGHSLRAGLCTEAAERGYDLTSIVKQSRHKSLSVAADYVRPRELWVKNPSEIL